MQEKLLNLQEVALNDIKDANSIEQVENLRVKYLGKKGEITAILKEMGKLSAEERPVIGKVANEVREALETNISSKKEELKSIEQQKKAILKEMGKLSAEERPVIGKVANEVREALETNISSKKEELKSIEQQKKLLEEVIDVTMPSTPVEMGKRHPISQIIDEITEIFMGMGFSIAEGPEVGILYSRRSRG